MHSLFLSPRLKQGLDKQEVQLHSLVSVPVTLSLSTPSFSSCNSFLSRMKNKFIFSEHSYKCPHLLH